MHKLRRAMVRPDRDLLSRCRGSSMRCFIGNENPRQGRRSQGQHRRDGRRRVDARAQSSARVRMEVSPLGRLRRSGRVRPTHHRPRVDNPHRRCTALRALSEPGLPARDFVGLTSALPAHVFLPGVHMVASLLKRWLTGTLHYARLPGPPGLLPGRVHLPLQPAHRQGPRPTLLPPASNKPSAPTRTP